MSSRHLNEASRRAKFYCADFFCPISLVLWQVFKLNIPRNRIIWPVNNFAINIKFLIALFDFISQFFMNCQELPHCKSVIVCFSTLDKKSYLRFLRIFWYICFRSSDEGKYTCVRTNEAGSVNAEAWISVLVRTQIIQPPVDTKVILGKDSNNIELHILPIVDTITELF